jgi:hypothetical protein
MEGGSQSRRRRDVTVVRGSFEVTSWHEEPYHEEGDRKLTTATVEQRFSGDIDGHGLARWLMAYRPDGTAHFAGLQRVEGSVDGSRGSVVLQTTGAFDGRVARWDAVLLEGAGTIDGLSGSGRFEAPHGSVATYEIDLERR